MRWLLCKVFGHRWRAVLVNWRRHDNLAHLCERAGCRDVCDRCRAIWDDSYGFSGDATHALPQPLPAATALTKKAPTP